MLALVMSVILWGLTLLLALLVALWLFIGLAEYFQEFHREGMERVRRGKERDKCLQMLVELHKIQNGK